MAEDRAPNSKSGEKTLIRDISFCGVPENGSNASMVDVKDGKIIRIRPMHYDWKYDPEKSMNPWKMEVRGQHVRAEHEDAHPAVFHRLQEARLLAGPRPLSPEEGGLGPQRRAQPAEPGQEQVRAHLLGRGARHHRQRDEPPQGEVRPDRHPLPVRPARREQGRAGLPRRRPQAPPAVGRLHPPDPSARLLGRLVVGQQALLGMRTGRPGQAEQPALRRGQELRAAPVLGLRPGDHPVGLAGSAPEPPELLVHRTGHQADLRVPGPQLRRRRARRPVDPGAPQHGRRPLPGHHLSVVQETARTTRNT